MGDSVQPEATFKYMGCVVPPLASSKYASVLPGANGYAVGWDGDLNAKPFTWGSTLPKELRIEFDCVLNHWPE